MNFLNEVKSWLNNQYIRVPENWTEACIEWVTYEHQANGRIFSSERVKSCVYDQWLFADLRELATPCLPEESLTSQKYLLHGCFSLQMNCVRDVSQPAYSQLLKLQGKENDNTMVSAAPQPVLPHWESKPNRMLMLTLTDGVHYIQGMEYKPITSLNVDLPPGTKLLISGPVECRLGVLLLTPGNVKVLGGEVESMLEENSKENIITRAIRERSGREDLTNNQSNDQQTDHNRNLATSLELSSDTILPTENTNALTNRGGSSRSAQNYGVDPRSRASSSVGWAAWASSVVSVTGEGVTDMGNRFERTEINSGTSRNGAQRGSFSDSLNCVDVVGSRSELPAEEQPVDVQPIVDSQEFIENYEEEMVDDFVIDEEQLEKLERFEQEGGYRESEPISKDPCIENHQPVERMKSACIFRNSPPFTYLDTLLSEPPSDRERVVIIKGFITTLTSKLESNKEFGWQLRAKINDGSGSVEVDLDNHVLEGLLGLNAHEVLTMKSRAKLCTEVRNTIMQSIQRCQHQLLNLSCLMEVQFSPGTKRPRVLKCYEVRNHHLKELLQRVSAFSGNT
ncbi:recQ-mediated genome instability protein 1-like [Limulus polyphemus]|uniref:RecQ-mediated genome instability protein 1 n=1 Tax=Limulus polyphemus TaxID=6850 RepID=A0ABM1TAW4_LIMPO|nr:recQ-mediated genome instability protein 1-like [Limulus polyphemus]